MADDYTPKPSLGRRKSSLNTLRELSQRFKHAGRKPSDSVEEEREIIGGKHVPVGAVPAIACSSKCRVLCFRARHCATSSAHFTNPRWSIFDSPSTEDARLCSLCHKLHYRHCNPATSSRDRSRIVVASNSPAASVNKRPRRHTRTTTLTQALEQRHEFHHDIGRIIANPLGQYSLGWRHWSWKCEPGKVRPCY